MQDQRAFGPEVFRQSVDEYITSIHSRNGFSRDRMPAQAALPFDQAVRDAAEPHAKDGSIELHVETRVVWGQAMVPT